jgi:hypothetical protein
MNSFPLYDNLSVKFERAPTQKDCKEFIRLVKKMDADGIEKCLALIRYYQLKFTDDLPGVLPFGGTQEGVDLVFDMTQFPPVLKYVLLQFARLHTSLMAETSS